MKKFLIALTLIIVANLGCKKEEIGGDKLCACSPVRSPSLSLVVKNAAGTDLLNSVTPGYYAVNQIQLYYIGANGNQIPVKFVIRPEFSYGKDKFLYNQIFSEEIATLAKSNSQSFYLKLGSEAPYELNLEVGNTRRVEKLLINKMNSPADIALVNYVDIFYLTL